MSDFIRVLGDDPYYKGHKSYLYLPINSIHRVCPIYAIKDEKGSYWRCAPEHEGAEILSYQVFALSGNDFSCGDPLELEKLGISNPQPRPQIGFINQEDSDKLEVDIAEAIANCVIESDKPST